MNIKELVKEHKKYQLFDLTDEQMEKVEGEYYPGCKIEIHWHIKYDHEPPDEIIDNGYCFELPGMGGEGYGDFFVHVPCAENPAGKDEGDSHWLHINKLLELESVIKVILK
jgi:hypothetical protein